ncbi:MAG: SDR family oxidoreductase [Thermoleophilaceae bacterium]|nr:SDR family oxidoreductase [Thermoleophilaceae bacterium]
MKSFANKVVVVTGAGSGMGRAYAKLLAERGAILALNDYNEAELAETVDLLPPSTRAFTRAYDVSDRGATYAFAAEVSAELGDAAVVINNAGIEGSGRPVWATGDEIFERVMDVNFYGVMHSSRAFLPQLLRNPEGALVNVSSIFGLVGAPSSADYCASKFAVRGFTEALAAELIGTSVAVHLVHPGGIATNISRREESQAFNRKYLSTPPEEIAEVVLDAVIKGRSRVVYGNGAKKTALGARLLPMKLLAQVVRRDVDGVLDKKDYPARG